MKAILQDRYGPPEDVLHLREIERPVIGAEEVLVRVRAASIHPDVWHAVTGRPYIARLFWSGAFKPRHRIPGTDLAGVVEAVGKQVTRFTPGDEVFGETYPEWDWRNGGSFAQYAAASQQTLALKPAGVSFEKAAAIPASGSIAMLNLRSGRLIQPGHRVLINGAGGGVGTMAVQLSKAFGARVTGIDGTEKLAMIRAIGADHVIDYTREDFLQRNERYDLIFDVASNLTLQACKQVLTPAWVYVFIGHDHFGAGAGRFLGSLPRALKLMAVSRFESHLPDRSPTIPSKSEIITLLREFLEGGHLSPVIDRTYPLEGVPEAMGYLQSGQVCGKVVIIPG